MVEKALNEGAKYLVRKAGMEEAVKRKYDQLENRAMQGKLSQGQISKREYNEYKQGKAQEQAEIRRAKATEEHEQWMEDHHQKQQLTIESAYLETEEVTTLEFTSDAEKQLYAEVLFVQSNFDEAYILFNELAEDGNPRAMFHLGEYYRTDAITGSKDTAKALTYHKKGYELGDILCTYGYARILLSENDKSAEGMLLEIFDHLLEIAKDGNPVVQNIVGACYEHGYGTNIDAKSAFHFYNLSAKQGYSWAQNNVATCYLRCIGVEQDVELARKYTELASGQGFVPGLFNAGLFAELDEKYKQAIYWYSKAGEKGYAPAIAQLKQMRG